MMRRGDVDEPLVVLAGRVLGQGLTATEEVGQPLADLRPWRRGWLADGRIAPRYVGAYKTPETSGGLKSKRG